MFQMSQVIHALVGQEAAKISEIKVRGKKKCLILNCPILKQKRGQQLINQHQLCDCHTFELLNRLEFEITVLYLEYFGNPPLCGLESIQLCASRNLRWLFLYQQQQLDSRHNNGNRQQKQFSFFFILPYLFCVVVATTPKYIVKNIVIT